MGAKESREAAASASAAAAERAPAAAASSPRGSKNPPARSAARARTAWDAIFVVEEARHDGEDDGDGDDDDGRRNAGPRGDRAHGDEEEEDSDDDGDDADDEHERHEKGQHRDAEARNGLGNAGRHGTRRRSLAQACVEELARRGYGCHLEVAERGASRPPPPHGHAFNGGLRAATNWVRRSSSDRSSARMKRILVLSMEESTLWSSGMSALPMLRTDFDADGDGNVGMVVSVAQLVVDAVGRMQARPGLWLCPCDGLILGKISAKTPTSADAFVLVSNALRPCEAQRRFRAAYDPVDKSVECLIGPAQGPAESGGGACLLYFVNFDLAEEIAGLAERLRVEDSVDVVQDLFQVLTSTCTADGYASVAHSGPVPAEARQEIFETLHKKRKLVAVVANSKDDAEDVAAFWPLSPRDLLELYTDTPEALQRVLDEYGCETSEGVAEVVETVANAGAGRQVRTDSAESNSSGAFHASLGDRSSASLTTSSSRRRVSSRSGSVHDEKHVRLEAGAKVFNSLLVGSGTVEAGSLVLDARLSGRWHIDAGSLVVGLRRTALRRNLRIGPGLFVQEVALSGGGAALVVRGVTDDPSASAFVGKPIDHLLQQLPQDDLWPHGAATQRKALQDAALYPVRAASRGDLHLAQFYVLHVLAQRVLPVSPLLHYRARNAWRIAERVSLRYIEAHRDAAQDLGDAQDLSARVQAFLVVAALLEHGSAGVDQSAPRIRGLLRQDDDLEGLMSVLDGVAANAQTRPGVAGAALECIALALRQRHSPSTLVTRATQMQVSPAPSLAAMNLTAIFAPCVDRMASSRTEAVQQAARLRKSLADSDSDESLAVQYDRLARKVRSSRGM